MLPLGFLLHVAFVPLLLLEDRIANSDTKRKGWKFFGYAYLTLVLWNILTTWWVYNATAGGALFAMFANAFLMSVPLILFHHTKRRAGNLAGYFSFVVYWLSFEYIHLNWTLTWPWLTLGNAFSSLHSIVQWYEFTGHLGGSLWVLIGNLLIFFSLRAGSVNKIGISLFGLWFGIPLLLSLGMYFTHKEEGKPVEVVVVQPNIDPYEEKFQGGSAFIPYEKQMARLMALTNAKITPNTQFVAWPETALPFQFFEHELKEYDAIHELLAFSKTHPQASIITGIDSYKLYGEKGTPSSRYQKELGYYDAFNTAMQVDSSGKCPLYHKSKLVPGVEYMPSFINRFAINLGGNFGGLGCADKREVFSSPEGTKTAPVICYESIFGEFVTEYVRNGAEFITIITNDGWWGNTPGHRQHLEYARLRAIETRKSIARSANTGISGFLNQRGDILQESEYMKQDVMKGTVYANKTQTFYVKYGDYIGLGAIFFAIFCLTILLTRIFKFRLSIKPIKNEAAA